MPMSVQSCTKTLGTTETPFSEPLLFSLSAQRKAETIGIYRNDSMSSLFSEKAKAVVAGSLPPGRLGAPYGSKNRRR